MAGLLRLFSIGTHECRPVHLSAVSPLLTPSRVPGPRPSQGVASDCKTRPTVSKIS